MIRLPYLFKVRPIMDCYKLIGWGMRGVELLTGQRELLGFFASYLRDMAVSIRTVKTMVYALINVDCGLAPPPSPSEDIHSLVAACNRTHEDIRRIETLLRGHLKGRERINSLPGPIPSCLSSPSVAHSRMKEIAGNTHSTQMSRPVKAEELREDLGSQAGRSQPPGKQVKKVEKDRTLQNSRSEGQFGQQRVQQTPSLRSADSSCSLSSLELIRRIRSQLQPQYKH